MNVKWLMWACISVSALAFAPPARAAAPTKVVIFAPWSAHGLRHGFAVSQKRKGTCWTHSLSTSRADAWRCMTENEIYDPCIAGSPQKSVVACVQAPFSNNVILLHDSKPLDGTTAWVMHGGPARGEPWALRLSDGDTCVYETGATDIIAGKRMNYACTKAGWIVGFVNRSAKIWTAQSVASPSDKHIKKVTVAAALF